MPEILTKHPEVVIQVLRSEGARCGEGAAPRILTKCPKERFCALAGGELCVYGPREVSEMTQLSRADLSEARSCSFAGEAPGVAGAAAVLAVALFGRARKRAR